jgi:DeoR-like helix-turn-helix domain.
MDKAARCLDILKMLQENGVVRVDELAEKFGTSEMTIRRDLKFLSQQYNIQRTYGGAIMPQGQPVVRIISFDEERIKNKEAKKK